MSRTPTQQTAADLDTLRSYLASAAPGAVLTWTKVQADTGVTMDYRGRGLLRRAARAEKREYLTRRGEGIELSSPTNAMTIVRGRVSNVNAAVQRAEVAVDNVSASHLDQMSAADREKMLRYQAFFGHLHVLAAEGVGGSEGGKVLPMKGDRRGR